MSSSRERAASLGSVVRCPSRTAPVVVRDAGLRYPAASKGLGAHVPLATPREALEEARRAAYEEGRLAGLAEARSATDAQRHGALDAVRSALTRVAAGVSELRQDVIDEVTGELAALSVDIAEAILGGELALGRTAARDAVRHALSLVAAEEEVAVRVHPDCGLSDAEVAEIAAGLHVRVVRDESVDPTGCAVAAGPCHVEAGFPLALARVRAALDDLFATVSHADVIGAAAVREVGRQADPADGAAA